MNPQDIPWTNDPQLLAVTVLVTAALGLIGCLFGYRLFKCLLGAAGFVLGGLVGAMAGRAIYGGLGAVIGGLLAGALGAVLLVVFYFAGVFAVGAMVGALIGLVLAGDNAGMAILAAVVLAVIGGVAALVVQKQLIVLSTALMGAYLVALAVAHFAFGGLDQARLTTDSTYPGEIVRRHSAVLACWLGLALMGVIAQCVTAARKGPASDGGVA